jgi:hypothetical protein
MSLFHFLVSAAVTSDGAAPGDTRAPAASMNGRDDEKSDVEIQRLGELQVMRAVVCGLQLMPSITTAACAIL